MWIPVNQITYIYDCETIKYISPITQCQFYVTTNSSLEDCFIIIVF